MPPFTWSDSWLLLSIGAAGGRIGAPLKDIIAAGDLLNHAVFTGPELRRGLSKLVAAGYVVQVGDRFQAAGEALELLQQSNGVAIRSVWERCDRLLGLPPNSYTSDANVEDPNWSYAYASEEVVQAACREYQSEAVDATQIALHYAARMSSGRKRP